MNRRRIMLSILLSCLMILTTLTPVFAADSNNINDSDSKTIGEVSKKTMAASARSVGDTFEDTFEKDGKTFTITYVVTDASANEVSFALKNDPTTNIKELSGMYEIPSSVTYNGTEYTVTSIADNAFYKWSFSEQINTKCTYIIIPDTIIKIGANAFEQNTNLKSIYIPDSVTSIGESAFSGCYNAKKLRFSRNLTALPDYAFFNIRVDNLVIPGNIKTIGSNMIRNEWLESVKVLEGVESIASKSFMNWNNTTREVELPASLTSLDSGFIDNRLNSTDAKLTIHSPSLNIDFTKPLAYVNSGTVYGHSGSAGSPSQVKQNFDANQFSYSGVSFSTEGVCHSNNVKSRTEPTCGEDGSVTYEAGTCDCGNTNVPETTIALSATGLHDCSWKITKEPTCTAKGTKVFKCDTCGDVFIEPIEIPATGVHDYSVEVTEKAASCTENGLKYMKCKYCDLKDDSSEKNIPALGHKFNKEVIDEKATYEKEGKKHMECSVCGAKDESSHVSISKLIKQGTEGKDKDSVSDGSTVTKTTETNSKTKIDTPDTSDSSNAIFYGLIAIIAIAGVGGTIFKIKRVS